MSFFGVPNLPRLMPTHVVDLGTALVAAQKLYGSSFNPEITLKALSYFDDGDLRTLPEEMKARLAAAAREVGARPRSCWDHRSPLLGVLEFENGALPCAAPTRQDFWWS